MGLSATCRSLPPLGPHNSVEFPDAIVPCAQDRDVVRMNIPALNIFIDKCRQMVRFAIFASNELDIGLEKVSLPNALNGIDIEAAREKFTLKLCRDFCEPGIQPV